MKTSWLKKSLPILIILLFAGLTAVYFREVIASDTDALLTKQLATDLYGHFVHVHERLEWLKDGFIGIGNYWVPRGGGFPAANNDQLLIPQEFGLMVIYAITGNLAMSMKILYPLFYFLCLLTTYWYGTIVLRRRDASIVLAVAYSFSMYGANQLDHMELIGVPFLIMLTLVFLEKTLRTGKARYILLGSLGLFLVLLSNLYAIAFLAVFVLLRFVWQFFFSGEQGNKWATVSRAFWMGIVFLLLASPYLVSQLHYVPSDLSKEALRSNLYHFSRPPELFFQRNVEFIPYFTEIYYMYLGIPVIFLALLPVILKYPSGMRRLYIFHLLTAVLCFVYAIGQYSPVNLAIIIHDYVPFFSFIRVPGRVLVIGYLSFSLLAAVGYTRIAEMIKSRLKEGADGIMNKIIPALPLVLIVPLIFIDLTAGFEPTTMPAALKDNESYGFIREQPGDFRIIEVPSVHDQQAMTAIYTGHDTLNMTVWAYDMFRPLDAFIDTFEGYRDLGQGIPLEVDMLFSLPETERLAEKSAFYGVKYVLINTDNTYFDTFFPNTGLNISQTETIKSKLDFSADYRLVQSIGDIHIYENLKYQGKVFIRPKSWLNTNEPYRQISADASLHYEQKDPNTLVIEVVNSEPVAVCISQSYADGWIAEIMSELTDGVTVTRTIPVSEVASIQYLTLEESGRHSIRLHYVRYESSLLNFPIFYLPLLIIVPGVIIACHANKKRWLQRLVLPALIVYGTMLTVFAAVFYPQVMPEVFPLYQFSVLGLGVTMVFGPVLTYLFLLARRRKRVSEKDRTGEN